MQASIPQRAVNIITMFGQELSVESVIFRNLMFANMKLAPEGFKVHNNASLLKQDGTILKFKCFTGRELMCASFAKVKAKGVSQTGCMPATTNRTACRPAKTNRTACMPATTNQTACMPATTNQTGIAETTNQTGCIAETTRLVV